MDPYQSQARAHEQGPAEHGPSGQPPQAFTALQRYDAADGRGEQQYAQRHEQHQQPQQQQQQHQAVLAVAGQLAVLPKAQDVRVQCEAPDCQSLLQVVHLWPAESAAKCSCLTCPPECVFAHRNSLWMSTTASACTQAKSMRSALVTSYCGAQVSIPITQQLRSPVIVRCGGCQRC